MCAAPGAGSGVSANSIQNVEAPPLGKSHHARRDFVERVLPDFFAAIQAEGVPGARVEQPQVIVNFRRSGDGGARIARGVLLADGNGRGDASDFVHIRLLDALEELPRVCRKRFDVAPLPLGIERVERQAGFAGPGYARYHSDRVVRDREVYVLKVMDARSADADFLSVRRGQRRRRRWQRLIRRVQLLCAFRWHVPKQKIIRLRRVRKQIDVTQAAEQGINGLRSTSGGGSRKSISKRKFRVRGREV